MAKEFEIKPVGKFSLKLVELWDARELLYFFCWRDLKVKYKQTYLGLAWVILQPICMMGIYTLLFNKMLNASSNNIPYPIFVYSGLLFWGLFSSSVTSCSDSMVTNSGIIKKIYFPRLVVPISSVFVSIVDFLISILIFIIIILISQPSHFDISNALWSFPLALAITITSSLGIGTFLASLNVKYRDFRYILPFLVQGIFFISPVVYSTSEATLKIPFYSTLRLINPIATAIDLVRLPFHGQMISGYYIWGGVLVTIIIFIIGIFTFRKTEAYFADIA